MKIRVLIADDHAMVADGIRRILEPECEIAGVCEDGRTLVQMAGELKPDVIIVDISMPLLNGLDAVRKLKSEQSSSRVVFLTGNLDSSLATEAYQAGASGYVLKQSAPAELVTAVREAMRGRVYISPRIAGDVVQGLMQKDKPSVAKLSQREREVLQLLAEGRSIKEAAAVLGVSPRTVEFHKQNLVEKTGLKSTAELARYAARQGIV